MVLLDRNTDYRNILDNYPLIRQLSDRVKALPNIKAFLEKRKLPLYQVFD